MAHVYVRIMFSATACANKWHFESLLNEDLMMDLVALTPTVGGQYHREWLPVLNTTVLLQSGKQEGSSLIAVGHSVRINDKVDEEDLRDKQAGRAKWDPLMVKEIGKIGTVSRVDHDGDVHVEYKESGKKWCFNPAVLEKVSCYAIGQAVRVRNRGAAYDEMINELRQTGRELEGKTGSVVDVTADGMIIIKVDQMKKSISLKESWVEDVPLVSKLRKVILKLTSLLAEASGDGDLSSVKNLITKHGVPADAKHDRGVTALHMASRNGHVEIVKYLMKDFCANPDNTDDRGRTAIYFAVKGRQLRVIEFLMDEKVQLNLMTSNKKLSPLQKAVTKQSKECVKLLISNTTCDVNQVDEDGNTPLHNAAYRSRLKINDGRAPEIVQLLIECGRVNQFIRNKKGFNALHAAVSAGDLCVVNYLLANDVCGLGFEKIASTQTTSLHLACDSKHYEIGKALVEYFEKKVNEPQPSSSSSPPIRFQDLLNAKDSNEHTPLMMACFKGAYGLVELLVNKGADIHSVDKDGDSLIILTALHMRRKTISQNARAAFGSIVNQSRSKAKRIPDETISPDIFKLYTHYMADDNSNYNPMKTNPVLSIVYFLIRNGCSWSASKNKTSKIVDDDFVMVSIDSFALNSGQSTVDEDSSLASNGIQPDYRVEEYGGQQVPRSALRSDVEPVKCDECNNTICFVKFVSCGHTCAVCNKCILSCPECRRQTPNTTAAETTMGVYVKQTVPNVPYMTQQRPSARNSNPNLALFQPDLNDSDDDFVMGSIESFALDMGQSTVDEDPSVAINGIHPDSRVEDSGPQLPGSALRSNLVLVKCDKCTNNLNFVKFNSCGHTCTVCNECIRSCPECHRQMAMTAAGTTTAVNETVPNGSHVPQQQPSSPSSPNSAEFYQDDICYFINNFDTSLFVETESTSGGILLNNAVDRSIRKDLHTPVPVNNGFVMFPGTIYPTDAAMAVPSGTFNAITIRSDQQQIFCPGNEPEFARPELAPIQSNTVHKSFPDRGSDEDVPVQSNNYPAADIQHMPPPHQPDICLNGHNTYVNESFDSNEINNNNGQRQPIIITVLAAPTEVEQSCVTTEGSHKESNVFTESTNTADIISLTTTREETSAGTVVHDHSQRILLAAQNAAQILTPQLAAVTIPTAVPPTSSKVKKKVTVQVGDGGATQEWTLIEKGSRKQTNLLVDPDENGYTKNGNRWLCTRAAPPKQEGEKNEKCPAKVQENSKDGSYTVISSIHLHIPENGKRKNHEKQLQKPPSKKQK